MPYFDVLSIDINRGIQTVTIRGHSKTTLTRQGRKVVLRTLLYKLPLESIGKNFVILYTGFAY